MKIHKSILLICEDFEGILLDAYGVFWAGNRLGPFREAVEAMKTLVERGKIVGILSNSSQMSRADVEKFSRHGIREGEHFHFAVTSGDLVRKTLEEDPSFAGKSFAFLGEPHPHFSPETALFAGTECKEVPVDKADFLYPRIPHVEGEDQTDPELFRKGVADLSHRPPMLCPNPDQFTHEGSPPKAVVRQGSIAALYNEMGGSVHFLGKPHKAAYERAMERFHEHGIHSSKKVLMVGDTPETDIRGARAFGMPSALVLLTGMACDRIQESGLDAVWEDLPVEDRPDFLVEKLGE